MSSFVQARELLYALSMIQRHKGRIEPEELCSQLGLSQTKIMQILTFDGVGYKALSLAIVMEKGMLKRAPQ
jgi:hypothetical protein